jgi:hypothetical protein
MEPVLFVMAILGCGENDAPCREVALAETRYRSEAACLAATEPELARQDILYPIVAAECRGENETPRQLRGNDVSFPGGTLPLSPLHASISPRFAARSCR